jgi:hypothetical protein
MRNSGGNSFSAPSGFSALARKPAARARVRKRFVTAQAPVFETVIAELRWPEADPLDVVRLSSADWSRSILDGSVLRHQLHK